MNGYIAPAERLERIGISRLVFYCMEMIKEVDTKMLQQISLKTALKLGADIVASAGWEDVKTRVAELTGGKGADVVVEATGYEGPLNTAAEIVRIRGTLVAFRYHQGGRRSVDMQMWN